MGRISIGATIFFTLGMALIQGGTALSWARSSSSPECEFAAEEAEQALALARREFGVAHSMEKFRELVRRCSLDLGSLNTSEEELLRLESMGRRDIYRHGLELLRLGLPVSAAAFSEVGGGAGYEPEKVSGDYAAARATFRSDPRFPPRSRESCGPVDLRDRLPPIRNQGSLSWCYAHVMADMLSFKYDRIVSASALAHLYNAEKARSFASSGMGNSSSDPLVLEGGSLEGALEAGWKSGGFCSELDQPSEDFGANRRDDAYVGSLRQIAEIHERLNRLGDYGSFEARLCGNESAALKRLFPGLSALPVRTVLNVIRAERGAALLGKLSKLSCPDKITSSEKPKLRIFRSDNGGKIHQLLEEKKLGAIYFDSSVLYDPRGRPGPPNHVSLVVGRRWNPESRTCELLIRNSHGTACDYSSYFKCERGNIWIPSSYVERIAADAYTLE